MFTPDIEAKNIHDAAKALDGLDAVCELCLCETKCDRCPINEIRSNILTVIPKDIEVKSVGQITLADTCDLTDPCYDKDVWCRTTVENMLPGKYNCYAAVSDEKNWGDRVCRTWIIHEDFDKNPADDENFAEGLYIDKVSNNGVDAGLFGYFNNKPDFDDKTWDEFLAHISSMHPVITVCPFDGRDGFVTSSGYGDGGYDSVTWRDAHTGKVVAINTTFLEENYDDDM